MDWKRIIVKVGSNILTREDGTLDVTQMSALVDQIALLRKEGIEVILVSSGAVASGRSEIIPTKRLDSVGTRQLFSAVGQAKLINRYYELFRDHGITVGQVLTMKESFATRQHYLNQKNCMMVMLENDVIPIVNENDTVSVSELMFTDNDELSGLIASIMDAQALIILSNVDGILDNKGKVIKEIYHATNLKPFIQTGKSTFGRGGILTKIDIARKIADEGIEVIIANGRRENILADIINETPLIPYSRFIPKKTALSDVKKWIAHSEGFAKGKLHMNSEACDVLNSGRVASILPVGITSVEGEFRKGDLVRIVNHLGATIGVGKANCSSAQARDSIGKHGKRPVVHYDYLYIE